MNIEFDRYCSLMNDDSALTEEEINCGWHFCADWDLLLIGPGMGEIASCDCDIPCLENEKKIQIEKMMINL